MLPGAIRSFFGHDNDHHKVKRKICRGIGGSSMSYIHSVRLRLIDPCKCGPNSHAIAWTSKTRKASFVKKLHPTVGGIIGMEVMSQWKALEFVRRKRNLYIQIKT
jgi:hypothetical protein